MASLAHNPKRLRTVLPEARFFPAEANPVGSAVCTDPRRVGPGAVYVHLDALDASGAERAARNGAAAVIADRLLPELAAPLAVVEDAPDAHHRLRQAFAATADEGLLVIGGSIGRTATAALLARIAVKRRRATAVLAIDPARGVAPPATPAVACLTRLTADGLTTDGSHRWESAAAHRDAVVESLGPLDRTTTLVVNADDQGCVRVGATHDGPLLTFGHQPHADVVVTELDSGPGWQEMMITHGRATAAVSVATPGTAHRSNCAAAVATGLAAGLGLDACIDALGLAPKPYGMLEPVVGGQPFPVVVDRAVRPIALSEALAAAQPAGGGRLFAAVRLAPDPAVADRQLATAARLADRVIAHTAAPVGSLRGAPGNVTVVDDRLAAIAVVVGLAEEGDAAIVAGCVAEQLPNERGFVLDLIDHRLRVDAPRAAA